MFGMQVICSFIYTDIYNENIFIMQSKIWSLDINTRWHFIYD